MKADNSKLSGAEFFCRYADIVEGSTITESKQTVVATFEFDYKDSPAEVMNRISTLLETAGLFVKQEETDADYYRFQILK